MDMLASDIQAEKGAKHVSIYQMLKVQVKILSTANVGENKIKSATYSYVASGVNKIKKETNTYKDVIALSAPLIQRMNYNG